MGIKATRYEVKAEAEGISENQKVST